MSHSARGGGLTPNETLSHSNGKFVFDHGPYSYWVVIALSTLYTFKMTGFAFFRIDIFMFDIDYVCEQFFLLPISIKKN